MQGSVTIVPFFNPTREKHLEPFNSQGRCWKAKHRVRNGSLVKIRPIRQHKIVCFN